MSTYTTRPRTVEAWEYPVGGFAQHTLAKVLEGHGTHLRLVDGAVRSIDPKGTPYPDGTYYQWDYALVASGQDYLRVSARPGDMIVKHGEDNFEVVDRDTFDDRYALAEEQDA